MNNIPILSITVDPAQGLSRTLFSVFQSNSPNLFSNYLVLPGSFVDEMKSILLHGRHGVQHAVSRYILHAAPMTAAPELFDLESQHGNCQQVTDTGRGPSPTPLHPLSNFNSHSISDCSVTSHVTSETDDSATDRGYSSAHGDRDSCQKSLILPRRTRGWKVMFVVAVLSVIVLPGLVVGVMTKQMSWGIELSGAIAPILSLLAGLYYHTKK